MNTIFAVSSGKIKAGVAVIRISGRGAAQAFFALGFKDLPEPRKAVFAKLINNNEIIDQALCLWFPAPRSFTGEDTAEFHIHGSIAVIENITNVLSKIEGFRIAEPGEFSKRAFENGKMDLVQAEGLADLIEAETSAQSKQALRAMEGDASKIYDDWRTRIIEIMAFIEAYIDFPDENIPHDLDIQAQGKVAAIIREINSQIANDAGERIRNGAVATILGAPNVGKSTLINFLSKRELAIVSEIAGTTRDFLEAHLNIEGLPLTVIDTAGLRETQDKIEQEGVRRALSKAENADFKIILIDDEKNIGDVKNFIQDDNSILVMNKIDVQRPAKNEVMGKKFIPISLKEKTGLQELVKEIKARLEKILGNGENAIITRKRHKNLLQDCAGELEEFIAARQNNLPIELCGENLRRSAVSLGKIVGKIGVEDILDKIFSEFCIGK